MTKEEILDYVMSTPENTNRAVLSDMLDQFNNNAGGSSALIVEMEYIDTYGQECFKSTIDIDDIITAFKMGQIIIVHTPQILGYGFYEAWIQMTGYMPVQEEYGSNVNETLIFNGGYTNFEGNVQYYKGIRTTDNKLQIEVYMD